MSVIPLKWDGGVNLLSDSSAIADNQLALAKNVFPTIEGLLDKREPVLALGHIKHTLANYQIKPVTLFVPDPVLGLDLILHAVTGGGTGEFFTIVKLNQTMATTPPSVESVFFNETSNSPALPASFINYKGRVIGVGGGVEGFKQLNKRPDGSYYWTTVSFEWPANIGGVAAAQQQAVPVKPRVIATYRGRPVYANFGQGMGNWLVLGDSIPQAEWTNVDTAPTWAIVGSDVLADNGRHLELAELQGEEIVGMKEISLQAVGSPLSTALLVLATNGKAVICTGEPAQTTESDFSTARGYIADFMANKISFSTGLAGPGAICETPYGVCWASEDEVWLMKGNLPVPIGTLIGPALRECPPSLKKYWSMAYSKGVVYLAICTQASSSEKDLRIQHWRLDLRRGPEKATWWGPQDYENLPVKATNSEIDNAMAASIVVKDGAVVGAIGARGPNSTTHLTFFVSYNLGKGGEDTPYTVVSSGRLWSADDYTDGTVVPVGEVVRPTTLLSNGRLYVAIVAGVPGATEPTWPTTNGGTVADGGVIWAEIQDPTTWYRVLSYFGTRDSYKTNLIEIGFKDFNFNQPHRDKVARRAYVSAYSEIKTLIALRMLANGGNKTLTLGPVPIGEPVVTSDDFTEGTYGAANQLGVGTMDIVAPSQEYQTRTLRPGVAQWEAGYRSAGQPLADPAITAATAWNKTDTGLARKGGVVRGSSLQPSLIDGDGFVIDETNDYISWCSYRPVIDDAGNPIAIKRVYTAQIAHGYYIDSSVLMNTITQAMNLAQPTGAAEYVLSGFLCAASPWDYDGLGTRHPYFTTFRMAFTTRQTEQVDLGPIYAVAAMAFLFRKVHTIGATDSTTINGVTVYPTRTKRLLALLGMDVTSDYSDAVPLAPAFDDGSICNLTGERHLLSGGGSKSFATSPLRIYGIESIPYKRSAVISLSDVELDYYVKPGLPFSKVNR